MCEIVAFGKDVDLAVLRALPWRGVRPRALSKLQKFIMPRVDVLFVTFCFVKGRETLRCDNFGCDWSFWTSQRVL